MEDFNPWTNYLVPMYLFPLVINDNNFEYSYHYLRPPNWQEEITMDMESFRTILI
jgi:hypothetical protein